MGKQTFIRRIDNSGHYDYPPTSLPELQHWMQQVAASGYLKQMQGRGVVFEIVTGGGDR